MVHRRTTISPLSAAAMLATVSLVVASEAALLAMGKPGCETMCGNVSMPYPFGIGPESDRCSSTEEFKLTCDVNTTPPRLILGDDDGVFEVKEISIENKTVRVVGPPILRDAMYNTTSGKVNLHSRLGRRGLGAKRWEYEKAEYCQLVVSSCNIEATLQTTTPGGTNYTIGCTTRCSGGVLTAHDVLNYSGGFCAMSVIPTYLGFYSVELKRVGNGTQGANDDLPVYVVLAELDWYNSFHVADIMNMEKPADQRHYMANTYQQILDWTCRTNASCNTSLSANSNCSADPTGHFYYCDCSPGYEGNSYLTNGCQDTDECKWPEDHGCFGDCRNTNGSFQCSCPTAFHGDARHPNGCIK